MLKNMPLRPPDWAKVMLAIASLHNCLERRGTDPLLRQWIDMVKREREVERTEDLLSGVVEDDGMDIMDERSGRLRDLIWSETE